MSEIDDEKIQIDPSLRDTELGWIRRWDAFITAVTPAWFNILGWVALLAGLQFINAKHPHWLFQSIISISLLLMWQYFITSLCRFELILFARYRRAQIFVSIVLAFALAYGCYRLAQFAVLLIVANTS